MGSLGYFEEVFGKYGLMIPVFSNFGILQDLCAELAGVENPSDEEVQSVLSMVYTPGHLAAMVLSRYPIVPFVSDFKVSIAESVEAHFLGLGHVAVAGLMPVVEGVGRRLYEHKKLGPRRGNGIVNRFNALTDLAIAEVNEQKLGDYAEVHSMLNSFRVFLGGFFYTDSEAYPISDKTNRNGVAHGAYDDGDFGSPLNFYKTIGAIDMLCLIATFQVFPPKATPESNALAMHYQSIRNLNNYNRHKWSEFFVEP